MSTWTRALIRFLEGKHVDAVAAGEEPPFGGLYGPPPVPSVGDPPTSTILGGSTKAQGDSKKVKPSSSRHKDG